MKEKEHMPANPPMGENSYLIDAESGAELARLIDQDIVVTKAMGGLFPRTLDISKVHDVLDVACGPGGWAQEVAFQYPEMQVTGFDISQNVIRYAQAQAQVQHLDNLTFRVMDATKRLDFPDASFDLVNARAMIGFMSRTGWPGFVQEAFRILRPGGTLRLTDGDDMGYSNSQAIEELTRRGTQVLERVGKSFGPPGARNAGLTAMLGHFLREAGFVDILREAHAIDYSAGEPTHDSICRDIIVAFTLAQQPMERLGIITPAESDALLQQAQREMLSDDFRAIWYFLSVWGQKPE